MSSNVDDRIVRLQYEGSGFESGAAKAIETLDKLDEKLNLDGASEGLESVKKSLSGFSMDSVSDALQNTQAHFSKWQAFVSGVFFKLGGMAVDYGVKLAKNVGNALTKSAKDGFNEYEQQMKSVQTISANSGASLEDIQKNLDALNEYADKTSYVFSDMTSAIGRFTAAGLDVDSSTKAIQGFFNAAALSGAGAQEASRGVYQLSQAMSAGVVKLQDWRSIENASIDTEKFRDIIMMTAEHLGVTDDKFKKAAAGSMSFRESLASGWLTADVMQEALENLTMSTLDFEDAEKGASELVEKLVSDGYTKEQAEQIVAIATAADQSAREIRTFGAMMETLGESMGSGWAKTWQLIIGNYEESSEFFTWLSGRFSSIIDASSDARNKMLEDWRSAGGRDALVGIIANMFEAIRRVIQPVTDAFSDVFGITGKQLAIVTENIARFTEGLVISGETMTGVFDVFQAVFEIIHSVIGIFANGVRIVTTIVRAFLYGFNSLKSIGETVGNVFQPIAEFFHHLHALSDQAVHYINVLMWRLLNFSERMEGAQHNWYKNLLKNNPLRMLAIIGENLHSVLWNLFDSFKAVVSIAIDFVSAFWNMTEPFRIILGNIVKLIGSGLLKFFVFLSERLNDVTYWCLIFLENISAVWHVVSTAVGSIGSALGDLTRVVLDLFGAIYEVFGKPILATLKSWFDGLIGFIGNLIPKFDGFGNGISNFVLKPLQSFADWAKSLAENHNFETFKKWFEDISETVGGPFAGAFEVAKAGVENLVNFISTHFSGAVSAVSGWLSNANVGNPFAGIMGSISSVKIENPFSKIKLPKSLSTQLAKIRDKFIELGTSSDDAKWSLKKFIQQAGAKIKATGKDRILGVVDSIKESWSKLKNYFGELSSNGNSFSQNVKKVFGDIYNSLVEWTGRIADETSGFGSVLAGGFHWVLEKLGDIPTLFKNLFGETKTAVENGTKSISDSATKVADDQKSFWGNLFSNLPSIDDITSGLSGFLDGIKTRVSDGLASLFVGGEGVDAGSLKSSLTGLFDFSNIKITLPDFTSPVSEFIDQFSAMLDKFPAEKLEKIIDFGTNTIKKIGGVAFAFSGWKFLGSLTAFNKGFAAEGKGLGDLFSQLPDAVEGGMKGLGKAFGKDAAGQVKEGMTNIGKSLENIAKSFSPFKKQALSKSFRQVAEGLLILAGALFVLSRIPADDLERAGEALLKIMGVAAGFTFFAAWLSSLAKLDLQGVGYAMAGLGIAMIGMAGALYLFTQLSKDKAMVVGMQNFKLVLTELVAAMAILMAFSSVGNLGGVAATMIALSFAIATTLGTIAILGIMPAEMYIVGSSRLKQLGEFLVIAMVIMEIISSVGSAASLLAGVASMAALVVVITAAIVPLVLLSVIPTKMYETGINRLIDMREFFEVALTILSLISMLGGAAPIAAVTMIALVAAITLAIVPVTILGLLPRTLVDNGIATLFLLGGVMAALASLFTYVSASMLAIVGAAIGLTLMLVPITAMVAIVGLLSVLAHYDMKAMETAVYTLASIVAAIAAFAITGVVAGGGLLVCALGILAISGALWLLAAAVNSVDLDTFTSSIKEMGTAVGEAAANAVLGFVTGIATGIGNIIQSGVEMAVAFITSLLHTLGICSPSKETEAAGEYSAEGFINGIGNFLGQIFNSGEETGGNFLDGLSSLPDELATKASEAINTFITNLDTTQIVSKGNDIVQGLIDGIKSTAWQSLTAIPDELFHAIVDPILSFFGIQSPSTYMRDTVGANIVQGLIDGLKNPLGLLKGAASTLVTTIKNGTSGLVDTGISRAKEFGGNLVNGIKGFVGGARASSESVSNGASSGLNTLKANMTSKARDAISGFISSISSRAGSARSATTSIVNGVKSGLSSLSSAMKSAANQGANGFVSGIKSASSSARSAGSNLSHSAVSGASGGYNSMYYIGRNLSQGLADGINAHAWKAQAAASRLESAAERAVRARAKVKSPSRVFRSIGGYIGEGFILGMLDKVHGAHEAGVELADTVPEAFTSILDGLSVEDLVSTDLNPVITPVINPAEFDSSMSQLSMSLGTLSAMSVGNLNYTQQMSSKFTDYMDANEAALTAMANNIIDYDRLGASVAAALINGGFHVEMDGGEFMGYLAGQISDTRRMYAR